tara:strand:- start:73 stop:249 length:177 start_codon:yes stop_codon:yes gene_type:complete
MEQMAKRIHKTIKQRVNTFSIREDSLMQMLAVWTGTYVLNIFGEQIVTFLSKIALWII